MALPLAQMTPLASAEMATPLPPLGWATGAAPGDDVWRLQAYRQGLVNQALGQTWPARMARSILGGLTLPGDVYAGRVDPFSDEGIARSVDLAGTVMLGSGAIPAEASSLRAGAKISKTSPLPMDDASRLARAEQAGFHMDMPLYKGGNAAVTGFDPKFRATGSGSAAAKEGVAVALDPETANEFARLSAGQAGNAQIYPLRHRAKRPAVLQLVGDETDLEIAATLKDAWDRVFDAVLMKNYSTPSGAGGRNILFVKNENQLRSPWAAFDPSDASSTDLLSANASAPSGAVIRSEEHTSELQSQR